MWREACCASEELMTEEKEEEQEKKEKLGFIAEEGSELRSFGKEFVTGVEKQELVCFVFLHPARVTG